ncbi:hypothetical protein Pen02_54280 [Plantactinospora endophytica]|uniref:Uncharacterized protein n=1 Tax=Plantactinospora endophytica TaxID=673535 RepID=A0ABQ4E704_9ACTN|nr:hypothetical protein Pen02_54280 [Plantactinospora endophytica]
MSAEASIPAIHRRRRDPTDPRPARSIPYPGPAGAAGPVGAGTTAGMPCGIGSSSRSLPVPVMFPSIGEAAVRPRFQSGLNGDWTVAGDGSRVVGPLDKPLLLPQDS